MTEIGAQVDLFHPADRVWRTLTDRGLLARWFTKAEPVAGPDGRLLLHTADLPGFDAAVDAEVVDRREPELLALRCQEADRRTRLTCTILPTAEGCRLSVSEVLEHGSWPDDQRERREEYYQQTLSGRLPAILDWLAFQQVDLRRGEPGMTAELPVTEAPEPAPAGRRRLPVLIAAVAAAVLAAGAVAVWAVLPGEPERPAGSDAAALPTAPTATNRPAQPIPSSRPARSSTSSNARPSRTPAAKPSSASASTAPSAPALTARYETTRPRLLGYTGEVVIDNPGSAAADWKLVVTLPEGSTVTDARKVEWQQDGQVVTFTGSPVPAGGSQTVQFDVRDAGVRRAPDGCTVNDNPCAGL
ncbi:cellulose binding domain-containing protein [Micromonospora sp. LZ34]